MPYDPRPAIGRLASGESGAWQELWEELYHQGDVGTASYASVPKLTVLERERAAPEWNTYALVASIELARHARSNPPIPDWLERTYDDALTALAADATLKLPMATSNEEVRSMLSIIAISKGLRRHAEVLVEFSEEELEDVLGDVLGHG